jgi:hypothetical protein
VATDRLNINAAAEQLVDGISILFISFPESCDSMSAGIAPDAISKRVQASTGAAMSSVVNFFLVFQRWSRC